MTFPSLLIALFSVFGFLAVGGFILSGFFRRRSTDYPLSPILLGGIASLLLIPFVLFIGAKLVNLRLDYPALGIIAFFFFMGGVGIVSRRSP